MHVDYIYLQEIDPHCLVFFISISLGRVNLSPRCGRARTRFTLVEKEDIVAVAYSNLRNIRATATRYGVHLVSAIN
jgi:hypothetical protein